VRSFCCPGCSVAAKDRLPQFQRLGRAVGGLLRHLGALIYRLPQGLPVFYAPGEAEAVCAALSRASCVDGCGSNDSDCLVYGAEAVYHTLKLSVRRTIIPHVLIVFVVAWHEVRCITR